MPKFAIKIYFCILFLVCFIYTQLSFAETISTHDKNNNDSNTVTTLKLRDYSSQKPVLKTRPAVKKYIQNKSAKQRHHRLKKNTISHFPAKRKINTIHKSYKPVTFNKNPGVLTHAAIKNPPTIPEPPIKSDLTAEQIRQTPLNLTKNAENEKNILNRYDQALKLDKPSEQEELNPVNVFGSLMFVIILVLVFGFVYSRFKGVDMNSLFAGKFASSDENKFNILNSTTLGQGKSIHLVEIKGKKLVLGSTSSNINLLTEFKHNNDKPDNVKKSLDYQNEDEDYNALAYELEYSDVYKEYLVNKSE